jgi:hypothetical protein
MPAAVERSPAVVRGVPANEFGRRGWHPAPLEETAPLTRACGPRRDRASCVSASTRATAASAWVPLLRMNSRRGVSLVVLHPPGTFPPLSSPCMYLRRLSPFWSAQTGQRWYASSRRCKTGRLRRYDAVFPFGGARTPPSPRSWQGLPPLPLPSPIIAIWRSASQNEWSGSPSCVLVCTR